MQTGNPEERLTTPKGEIWRLSIKEIFFKYIVYLPLFIISVALALTLAWLYVRYATPIYTVRATMLVKDESSSRKGDKFEDLFFNNGAQNLSNEIEILKSRALMARVVKSLDLHAGYVGLGKIRNSNIYKDCPFRLTGSVTDSSRGFSMNIKTLPNEQFQVNNGKNLFSYGQLFQNENGTFRLMKSGRQNPVAPGREYIISWSSTDAMASGLAGAIRIQPVNLQGNVLSISMETNNVELGQDIVNQLMEEYKNYNIEDKNSMALNTLSFIDERLRDIQNQLDTVESRLLNFRQQNNVIDPGAQSGIYLNSIREYDLQLSEGQNKYAVAEFIEDYVKDGRNTYIITPSSLGLEDPTLNKLVLEYNELQQKREVDMANSTPEHPLVKAETEQLNLKRSKIMENIRKVKGAYQLAINNSSGRSKRYESEMRSIPANERTMQEIRREQVIKANLFEFLYQKKLETEISKASTISNSRVVDGAINGGAIRPNKRAIQALAILLGLALPGLFIFIKEILNDKVSGRQDIEKLTQAPVLGEVGHSLQKIALIATRNTRGMISEQFRILRTNLQYVLGTIDKPVIMVTSSFSGEGKSFVSTNLGAVLALAGKKTVILEFDIRKPKIISGLNMQKRPGITNFILGKVKVEELPVKVPEVDNLWVIPCGPVPPNPAELLLDPRLQELFDYAKSEFDVVVVDTAPVGLVSDAIVLGKRADATLYIVRQGYTYKKQIGLINEFYVDKRLPKIAIVINDVVHKGGSRYYGYGGGYGYGYGYGYFEDDEQKKPTFWRQVLSIFNPRNWLK